MIGSVFCGLVSEIRSVLDSPVELNEGNYPRKEEIIKFVSKIPLLPTVDNIELIVDYYIENYVMPQSFVGDAAHLAYASYYGIESQRIFKSFSHRS